MDDDEVLVARAVALASDLLTRSLAAATKAERRQLHRLGALLAEPRGRRFVQHLTDEVGRIRSPARAAQRFADVVAHDGTPGSLGPLDRAALVAGGRLAPRLPRVVMPLVQRRIAAETHGVVLPADDPALARHLARRRAEGFDLNVNLLGEAILSDVEAEGRRREVARLLARPDGGYVSVKASSLCANLDVFAFEHSVDRIAEALRLLYRVALDRRPVGFVHLDMEEHRDLELTMAAFQRVLDEPAFTRLRAGIVVQAYLPDAHDAMAELAAWARRRVDAGGASVKVRLVKGANLAMERVEGELHGWVPAPYPTKAEVDASAKRLLDVALDERWAGALEVAVGSHNLFDVAWALVQREARSLGADRLTIEMLEGMAPPQARAVARQAGGLLLYAPVVHDAERDASLAYLARRLDENTAPGGFLSDLFTLTPLSPAFAAQAEAFRAAVADRAAVATTRRRRPVDRPADRRVFANASDSDLSDPAVRARIAAALADPRGPVVPRTTTVAEVDAVVARAVAAVAGWAERGLEGRAALLLDVADALEAERPRALAVMAHEAAKTVREGDPEVSEAVDAVRYAVTGGADRLRSALAEGHEVGPRGVVVVASPWNFPLAIPAGGVMAALAAGNAVVLKPAPETMATARLLVEVAWSAGVPTDVLQFVACDDGDVGRRLITHPDVATVVLTGAYDTAQLFLSWRPSLRLLAETSGKGALVVTATADRDAAVRDVVASAFGHAGQKCSAASLCIVEASVHDDGTFLTRLADAVRSLRVGPATDPATMVGPLIRPPTGALARALAGPGEGERWLLAPEQLDEAGLLWRPGVLVGVRPGSFFHQTECFGPVLGIMRAEDLDDAIALQAGTPFGLTGGLHALDPAEQARWLARVPVGNAYVNRPTTGAVVRRQPFGGWKRSSVGGGPKAGGPSYVGAFSVPARPASVDVEAATVSYRRWWAELSVPRDVSGLVAERNLLHHVPLRRVVLRVDPSVGPGEVAAATAAAELVGVELVVSSAVDQDDAELAARLVELRPDRLRLLAPAASDELLVACHRLDVAVDLTPISTHGGLELPHWVREQATSETRHRYGRLLDPT